MGIGAPAIIAAASAKGEQFGQTQTGTDMVLPSLIPAAYADPLPVASPATPAAGPSIQINLESPVSITVLFLDEDQKRVGLPVSLGGSGQIQIPQLAKGVKFQVEDAFSHTFPIAEGKTFTVTVTGQRNFGFNQGFFGHPPSITYNIAVTVH